MVIAAALNTRDIHCRSLSMSPFLPLARLLKAVERTLNKWPALIGNDNYILIRYPAQTNIKHFIM